MNLKDKVAIITGSGQGIGLGIALVLAKEGCNIVVSDLNPETSKKAAEEIQKLGVKSISVPCNVANSSEVQNLINTTVQEMGKLDILVNNAGIYPFKPFLEMTEADWEKVMGVNLKGVFLCSQAAAKVMNPGSKILTISSIASIIGYTNLVHYCASKGGVNSFTRALALELAPKKINVNAIAPGAIETPGASMNEETKKGVLPLIPAGRIGSSLDIGKAVAFLVSDYADYITGQVLPVDGGWTIH
jgi:3-oxoacyl-[acyl-carrier protein] reductase